MTYYIDNGNGGQTQVELSGWTPEEIAAYRRQCELLENIEEDVEQNQDDEDDFFDFQEEANAAYWASRGC